MGSFTKSIPRVWLNLLHSESYELTEEYSNAIIMDGNTVNVESLNSRCINCILIKRISDSPTAKEKIESKYKDKIEWNEICKILIKTSIYTKLFNIKLFIIICPLITIYLNGKFQTPIDVHIVLMSLRQLNIYFIHVILQ